MKLAPQIGQLAALTNGCIIQAHSKFWVAAARLKIADAGDIPPLVDSEEIYTNEDPESAECFVIRLLVRALVWVAGHRDAPAWQILSTSCHGR
jgi:hypothetical protein